MQRGDRAVLASWSVGQEADPGDFSGVNGDRAAAEETVLPVALGCSSNDSEPSATTHMFTPEMAPFTPGVILRQGKSCSLVDWASASWSLLTPAKPVGLMVPCPWPLTGREPPGFSAGSARMWFKITVERMA